MSDVLTLKACSKCKQDKARDAFRNDRGRKDGLYPWCRDCERAYRQERDPSYGTSGRGQSAWLVDESGQKRCCRCHETKLAEEFHKNRARPDGYHHYCKACSKIAIAASDIRHPESKKRRVRKTYLKRRYGLTPAQYDMLVWEQNNKCAICHEEMVSPHVDHDHSCCPGQDTCGKCVRALLCAACNTSLGGFKDDPELLLRAVSYLDSYKEPLSRPFEVEVGLET